MAAYAIMRSKKLSTMGGLAAALQHAYRERDTPNADPTRTPENQHQAAASTNEAMGRLRELLPEKRRKDAVLAVEYVLTASPEWWNQANRFDQAEFFRRAKWWLGQKYGHDRIITATIHRDERTPHLTAFVVPLTKDGRLSAKEFIGSKKQMSQDQSSFAQAVQSLGLERGIEGSKATHQRIQSHYGAIQEPLQHGIIEASAIEPRVLSTKKGFFNTTTFYETPEDIAERLTEVVQNGYAPAVEAAATAHQERRKAKHAQDTAKSLRDSLKPILEALEPLGRDLREKLIEIVKIAAKQLLSEQRAEQLRQQQKRELNSSTKQSRGRRR